MFDFLRRALSRFTRSPFRVVGRIEVETRDATTGERLEAECGVTENIVVDVGLAELAAILAQETETTGYQIGVGTGSTAFTGTETDLQTRVYRANITSKTRSAAAVTFKLYVDTSSANGYTLTEAGLFHNNVLIDRATTTSVAKTAAKTVTYSITLTLSR